ncbi:hypothetical protein V6N13_112219 [Hibiscus sabdariffa]
MAQGLVHGQPLLYASPARDPRGFLGTLPSPAASKDDKSREPDPDQEKGLRIAWQYKKYFGENQLNFDGQREMMVAFLVLVVLLSNHFVLHSVRIPTRSGRCFHLLDLSKAWYGLQIQSP